MKYTFLEVFRGKKILVTGHTGFKGAWLCLLLDKIGAKVSGYALAPPTTPSLYEVANVDKCVDSTIGDIQEYQMLYSTIERVKPDAIIHMAAQALVIESYKNPVETYLTNVMGTVNLLNATRQVNGVKAIVNVTTDKCYENNEWLWGYRENDRLGGYDPYSNSKACSELVTASFVNSFFNKNNYDEHGVAIATARAGNVIGGGDWGQNRLIPDFIRAISEGQEIVIRNPLAIRPWQHVLEPLTGYLNVLSKLLTDGPKYSGAWNLGPNDTETKNVEWIIYTICKKWGNSASFKLDENVHPHETQSLKLDISKAKSLLEWKPKWDIETTLDNIVEWHKAFYENKNMRAVCNRQIDNYLNA
ncbi:CDP-glucose 4,6-dehydratase [uncultured Draconibacterium sp.]|uniref:CDP-glucose 4,6-dehydratase n=1 Tax=uncultured Draconibacterium sp. TaxID=1573823 RepID=UPI0029C7BB30|nr:CDP-glucose 4,6-dehydratase [uncultured Draconibacterium sp.]